VADFNQAVQKTLVHEGGYVDNPNDKGGPTKYGITQADMPGVNIAAITTEMAVAYYREHYWKDLYSQINDQPTADKLFDTGVLFGVGTAVKLLQIALKNKIMVVSDGVFGEQTLAALNQAGANFVLAYRPVLLNHCMNIVNRNPSDGVFLEGWANRINS
jgi:lysozyme family protein